VQKAKAGNFWDQRSFVGWDGTQRLAQASEPRLLLLLGSQGNKSRKLVEDFNDPSFYETFCFVEAKQM
jgi:hypothetical protein